MNILFFSRSAVNGMYSFGNTVINLFEKKENNHYHHFFIRKITPDNSLIDTYYNLSSIDAVKDILPGRNVNHSFQANEIARLQSLWGNGQNVENKLIGSCRTHKMNLLHLADEVIWLSRIWVNRSFKKYISQCNPDVFFAFATNTHILWPLISYLKRNTSAKVVLFIADDMYSIYRQEGPIRKTYHTKLLARCVQSSDKLYGISEEICFKYEKEYHKPVQFLCKGCSFDEPLHTKLNQPLQLVYAGNILYGREKTLIRLVECLKTLKQEGICTQLNIYTLSQISEKVKRFLDNGEVSFIKESVPYEKLKKLNNAADIVLHVESFDRDQIEKVKYSFSTKITDCLQAGTSVLCIGPDGIASVEYLKKISGVTVVSNMDRLESTLRNLLSHPNDISQNAKKTRDSVTTKLKLKNVREKFMYEMECLVRNESI